MKAITILEPWASLIAYGVKKIETRSWSTKYRGKVAIHAGKSKKNTAGVITEFKGIKLPEDFSLNYGCVIAIAELVDCLRVVGTGPDFAILEKDRDVSGNEYIFGNYPMGGYAWILKNPKLLKIPVPAKGKQRIWNWSGNYADDN